MIETVGSIAEVLKNHKTREWASPAKLDNSHSFKFDNFIGDAPSFYGKKKSFSEILADSIGEVNNLQIQADKAIQRLMTGESKNIHGTMLAVEKAEISFKMMNQIRMKVVDIYKEIMRMQI